MTAARLPPIDPAKLNEAQQAVHDRIASGPRGSVGGPFTMLLHSPALASRVEQLGEHLRYRSALPARQRELAICTVGAHWRASYEWFAHSRLAEAAGAPAAQLAELGAGREPVLADEADRDVHAFAAQLLRTGRASDAVYHAAEAVVGPVGMVELSALVGYYTLLAYVLNVFQVSTPPGFAPPWSEAP